MEQFFDCINGSDQSGFVPGDQQDWQVAVVFGYRDHHVITVLATTIQFRHYAHWPAFRQSIGQIMLAGNTLDRYIEEIANRLQHL